MSRGRVVSRAQVVLAAGLAGLVLVVGVLVATMMPVRAAGHSKGAAGEGAAAAGAPGAVRYFPATEVQAAFDHGAVLLDGGAFMVHASRRDAPGMAEVHLKDTDIVHVLHGRATVVTGGAVLDGRTTAPDELRGAAIEGGAVRRLAEGDVLVVPRGVPHWFREVDAPFLYYVVKVR